MVGIGDDLKEVLQDIGTPFTIYPLVGTAITGEYLDYETYFDSSTEFRRQFCFSGDFHYDSAVEEGDIISFDSKYFLVINVKKSMFENIAVDHSNFFIQCNTLGKITRSTEVRNPTTYKTAITWPSIHEDVRAVQTEFTPSSEEEKGMDIVINRYTLYCQAFTDIYVGDRWYPSQDVSTEFYKIVSITTYKFPGILVCELEKEARE